MAGNDSLDTDSGDLVEVEMDIDEDVLIASDLSSDTFSESNEIDNLLDAVNDLSDGGSDSDTGTNVLQNDNHRTPDTTLDSDEDISNDNLAVDRIIYKMIHIIVMKCLMY